MLKLIYIFNKCTQRQLCKQLLLLCLTSSFPNICSLIFTNLSKNVASRLVILGLFVPGVVYFLCPKFLACSYLLYGNMPLRVQSEQFRRRFSLMYLTTLLTSPIEFSLYFQNYVRHLNQNFREVRKIYETGLRSKNMRVNLFY